MTKRIGHKKTINDAKYFLFEEKLIFERVSMDFPFLMRECNTISIIFESTQKI